MLLLSLCWSQRIAKQAPLVEEEGIAVAIVAVSVPGHSKADSVDNVAQ